MKKSKKLLSILLAVLMLLSSMSVMASAAKAKYQTAEDLEALQAYSKYGAVTRLDTDTRLSIIFDSLDQLLETANINPGQLFNILGLSLTVDLRSIDAICGTVDNAQSLLNNWLVSIIKGLLGIVGDLNLKNWQSGMKRDSVEQMTIVTELCEVLKDNSGVIYNVISSGKLDLGLASSAVSGLDLSVIADIPGLIKGLVFPLFERKDDDQTQIEKLANTAGNGGLQAVLNDFVKGLFTKPQSTTTYKEDAEGNCISGHTLPTKANNLRYYYEKGSDDTGDYYECYVYDTETKDYVAEEDKFYKTEESEGVYTYNKSTGEGLKYYKDGSYWLQSVTDAVNGGQLSVDLTTNSAASLLYEFIPYVFREMAPVVLNGSVKKLLGGVLGVTYTYVGEVGSEEVKALPDAENTFFTQEQGDYVWEWSDYAVINGHHYYRFEDQIFQGDTSNTVPFFKIINWDYKITDDFIDEFVPGKDGGASQKGYTTLLQGLNDFLVKAAKELLEDGFEATIGLETGDNTHLINNVKKAAQTVLQYSPETIFGAEYADPDKYYSLVMSEDNQEILIGIACTVIDLLMPQMILPKADAIKGKNYTVGAILAAVLRELATQLLPTHNYDALIYEDYNTKTLLTGKDNSYWLDVILTMGVDIGISYLKNLADMGEDTAAWAGMNWSDSKTYTAADLNEINGVKPWEAKVDYVVDWALTNQQLWAWSFGNLVDYGTETVDLATVQDPWVKLGNIFKSLLPVKEIFNLDIDGNDHWLETLLRDNFVLAIADLDLTKIAGGAEANGVLNIPTDSVLRKTNLFTQITTVLRNLINGILYKVAGQNLIADNITDFDAVLNQANLATFIKTLIESLYPAVQNGLLETVLPIVNFFVGWTTDAQKTASPTLFFRNPNDWDFVYTTGGTASTTLNIRNDSSGMLLKHRNSSVVDKAYNIIIDSVTCDDPTFKTETKFPYTVAPGAKAEVNFTIDYSQDTTLELTIKYRYTGKSGAALGGEQVRTTYVFVSNLDPDDKKTTTGEENNDVKQSDYKPYVFTPDVYDTITNEAGALSNVAKVDFLGSSKKDFKSITSDTAPTGLGDQYFRHVTADEAKAEGMATSLSKGDSTALSLYRAKDGVTEETELPYGNYDMGQIAVKFGSDSKVWQQIFVYYNEYGVDDMAELYSSYNLYADQFTAEGQNAFKEYIDALKDVTRLADYPKLVSNYVSEIMPQIEPAEQRLEKAYKDLMKFKKPVESTLHMLTEALTTAEPGGDVPEINYQDYVLYEYFEYQDFRTEIRNRIKEYNGPEKPEKYIPDSSLWGDTTVDEFLNSVTNDKKKLAINATVIEPTEAENEAYQAALAEWQTPEYTELQNAELAAKIGYYKQFLEKKTADKQFLDKEIKYADAQSYSEQAYSKDSWAAYQEAYKNAVAVNQKDGALQSEVFDAKYALMKAENELLAADKSMKDGNTLDNLNALIVKAEDIFQNSANYKVKGEMDETEAYKQLIEALGYKTESGEILYDHSALTFVEYDRETTQNNLDRLANAEEKLQAAINNFESNVVADIFPKEEGTEGQDHNGVVDTKHNDGVHTGGYLYGITPGEDVEEVFGSHATLNVVANDKGVKNGTGAVVQVMNGEQVVAEYVVIIFGDIDGDAEISAKDASTVKLVAVGSSTLAGAAFEFAADVDGDTEISAKDASAVKLGATGSATISQTRPA